MHTEAISSTRKQGGGCNTFFHRGKMVALLARTNCCRWCVTRGILPEVVANYGRRFGQTGPRPWLPPATKQGIMPLLHYRSCNINGSMDHHHALTPSPKNICALAWWSSTVALSRSWLLAASYMITRNTNFASSLLVSCWRRSFLASCCCCCCLVVRAGCMMMMMIVLQHDDMVWAARRRRRRNFSSSSQRRRWMRAIRSKTSSATFMFCGVWFIGL